MDTITANTRSSLLAKLRAGNDALAIAPASDGTALLDEAASALGGDRRVIRVIAGPGPLSLSGLLAQVADTHDMSAHDDSVVEAGFRRLAVPDAPGGHILLLISGADRLQRPALRFIQHVLRSAPALRVGLAGAPALAAMLDEPDFAQLRARLPAPPIEPVPVEPAAMPVRERVSSVSSRKSRNPSWAAAGLGLAASVAIAAWAIRRPADAPPPPAAIAVQQSVTPPAPVRTAEIAPVVLAPAPPPPAAVTPPAQPAAVIPPPQAAPKPSPTVAAETDPAPAPRPLPKLATASTPLPAPEPVTRQALLTPPVLPFPAPPDPAAPPHVATPHQADVRPRDAAPQALAPHSPSPSPISRRAQVTRPGRGAEPERGYDWTDEAPPPGPMRMAPRWARSEQGWAPPPPPPGPFIGTFVRNGNGMRTFHYEEGW